MDVQRNSVQRNGEDLCVTELNREEAVLVIRPAGRGFRCEWLRGTSARKINTETERKIDKYKEVKVRIAYSNCTVATVHIGNSVH